MALWMIMPEGMRNFLAFAVQKSQLPYSILLAFLLLYWLLVMAGAFDFEIFGVDVDSDLDSPDGPFQWFLSLFNIGELPVMIVISFVVLGLWSTAMITGMFMPGGVSAVFRVALFPVNLVVGALLAIPFIKPVAWLFRQNEAAREKIRETGSLARLRDALEPEKMGQALIDRQGASVMLNVKLVSGEAALGAGAEVVVVAKEGNFYRVKRFS
jgi:hypothetical protein